MSNCSECNSRIGLFAKDGGNCRDCGRHCCDDCLKRLDFVCQSAGYDIFWGARCPKCHHEVSTNLALVDLALADDVPEESAPQSPFPLATGFHLRRTDAELELRGQALAIGCMDIVKFRIDRKLREEAGFFSLGERPENTDSKVLYRARGVARRSWKHEDQAPPGGYSTALVPGREPSSQATRQTLAQLTDGARAGDINAEYELAVRYADDDGVAKDLRYAQRLLFRLATKGLPSAQFKLGELLENLGSIPTSMKPPEYWLRAAARQNYEPARCRFDLETVLADGGPKRELAERRGDVLLSEQEKSSVDELLRQLSDIGRDEE